MSRLVLRPPSPKKPAKAKKPSAKTVLRKADAEARARCIALGRCEAAGYDPLGKGMKCSGRLEWCHAKSRRFRAIRHLPDNCFCLCWVHHSFFTQHPDLWATWAEVVRPGIWEYLNDLLRQTSKVGRKETSGR